MHVFWIKVYQKGHWCFSCQFRHIHQARSTAKAHLWAIASRSSGLPHFAKHLTTDNYLIEKRHAFDLIGNFIFSEIAFVIKQYDQLNPFFGYCGREFIDNLNWLNIVINNRTCFAVFRLVTYLMVFQAS